MKLSTDRFFDATVGTPLAAFHEILKEALAANVRQHGRAAEWDGVMNSIPNGNAPLVGNQGTVSTGDSDFDYRPVLQSLMPWRKGPLQFGSTFIDTEWRSDWKWQRIQPHITSLNDRRVLDIGCGNGYHLFRMLGEGAKLALGIDPTILFNYQFELIQKVSAENAAYLLPLRGEHLPAFACFDTVFSMGVLYHRRSPVDHLTELLGFLRPGGELVLETLVIPGDEQTILVPEDRYAKMANVWFIPSPEALVRLVQRAGFINVSIVDVTTTTIEEQRATEWMDFQSLADFLDPDDHSKTVEGYPAPTRATLVAKKPG